MRIFLAKRVSPDAKGAGKASGFLIVETGEKVEEENAIRIFWLIRDLLTRIFYKVSHPSLIRIKEKVEAVKSLVEEFAPEKGEETSKI